MSLWNYTNQLTSWAYCSFQSNEIETLLDIVSMLQYVCNGFFIFFDFLI